MPGQPRLEDHLIINSDEIRRHLVGFLRQEIRKAGFQRALLGLSGGIDSAVACFLVVEALGPENVLALRMPYRSSSRDSMRDAQQVIDQLGIPSETVDITPMVDPLFSRIPDMCPRRRGNVMARMRMIILYDFSESWRGLVIGTSNKTELWLGYGTLFGDMACAINPLGDLYKTQVIQLARSLGVPASIISKPPSADLWAGQTDEGEIGFRYADLDRALWLLLDAGCSVEQAIGHGLEQELVYEVWSRIKGSEYKRRLPIIARLPESASPEKAFRSIYEKRQ